MSLDVTIYNTIKYEGDQVKSIVYSANITHNLGEMATHASIYNALWRPHRLKDDYTLKMNGTEYEYEFEDHVTVFAHEIIKPIERGLLHMKKNPEYYKKYNSPNGWGTYKHFIPFIEEYLTNLKQNPSSKIETDR